MREREKREEEEAVNLLVGQAGSSCVRACVLQQCRSAKSQ